MASVKAPQTRGSQRARARVCQVERRAADTGSTAGDVRGVRGTPRCRLTPLEERIVVAARSSASLPVVCEAVAADRDVMVAGRDVEHGARSGGADGALAPTAGTSSAG